MRNYKEITDRVQGRLAKLGYDQSNIARDVRTPSGNRIDMVVYEGDTARIILEVKGGDSFPDAKDPLSLRFNPAVRMAQSLAKEMAAPYYVVSNEQTDIWFTTDDTGRPQVLGNPVLPTINDPLPLRKLNKNTLKRQLQELIYVGFSLSNDSATAADWAAIALYCRLKLEHEDKINLDTFAYQNAFDELARTTSMRVLPERPLTSEYVQSAMDILNRISFAQVEPQTLLVAIDEILIDPRGDRAIRLPRWLSDFMLRLCDFEIQDTLVDIYSSYGDVANAALLINRQVKVWSICPTPLSALWTSIQRLVAGSDDINSVVGKVPPYDVFDSHQVQNPGYIFAAPPFGTRLDYIGPSSGRNLNSSSRGEELYLELALDWVGRKGRVVALVPENLLFSESSRRFRETLAQLAQIRAVIRLGSWSKTGIHTSILVFDKKSHGEAVNPVFMSRIDEVKKTEVFVSRDIDQISQVLNLYETWNRTGSLEETDNAWLITSERMNTANWSVDHYDPVLANRSQRSSSQYPEVPLREVAKVFRGSNLTLSKNGTLPVIGPASIRPLVLDPLSFDRTTHARLTRNPSSVKAGDTVVNAVGPYLGSAALVGKEFGGTLVSRNVLVLRPTSSSILPEFLATIVNSDYIKQQARTLSTGSVIKILTVRVVQDIAIPLPDIETQKQILGRILQAQDALIKLKRELAQAEARFGDALKRIPLEDDQE